jgi:hypothetical protein
MKLGLHWKLERRDWLILAVISALPLVYVPLRSHYGEAIAMLAMTPTLLFAPVGWFFAEMAGTLAPSPELQHWFYGVGFSLGVFLFAYICLANWRYHHPRKTHAQPLGWPVAALGMMFIGFIWGSLFTAFTGSYWQSAFGLLLTTIPVLVWNKMVLHAKFELKRLLFTYGSLTAGLMLGVLF